MTALKLMATATVSMSLVALAATPGYATGSNDDRKEHQKHEHNDDKHENRHKGQHAKGDDDRKNDDKRNKKVGICHATGSASNPFVYIVVSENAAKAHKKHHDGRDKIGVKSADECNKRVKPVAKDDNPKGNDIGKGGAVAPAAAAKTVADDNPTTLPETGAGLSVLLGSTAMALAGREYLRSRK